ncbi:NUDIX hydrolase [Anoxynatronum buryatiense]|uniref:ADP-ribose pyrophosphatase YjhB, NUDIX family n=1 Tax=Anoxynatronum buryatiense TaxID=489973 RepID=A0AA46AI73_9CLOT|nr:CoA pyrophosphatase [Anoxynatronum buryatiense]SMP46516.1 ADP-ribose pyrophosphatase YjhB, NUDIX family [Anoxynatronum buryatiense]
MDYRLISQALASYPHEGYEKNKLFAVMIPLIEVNGETHVLFEVRSFELESQPGEICFPGGKMEKGETPSQTACRETMEELNLQPHQLKIIGSLPPLTTPFHFTIYPFCGVVQHTVFEEIDFSKDEVDSIFTIPLETLLNQEPEEFSLEYDMKMDPLFPYHRIPNGDKYEWKAGHYRVVFYYYQHYVIWGLTAKMLQYFLTVIRNSPESSSVSIQET